MVLCVCISVCINTPDEDRLPDAEVIDTVMRLTEKWIRFAVCATGRLQGYTKISTE